MKKLIKKLACNLYSAVAIAALSMTAVSCNAIYDDEGDCDPKYYLSFVFDMNMEFANAFKEQVESVEVWVFDRNTKELAYHVKENGAALSKDGFMLPLDIQPGDYHIVGWCNLEDNRHFRLSGPVTHFTHPSVKMDRSYDDEIGAYSNESLDELFHGIIDITAPTWEQMHNIVNNGEILPSQTEIYGTQGIVEPVCYWDEKNQQYKVVYTMSLIRNTNNIVLSLEHLSGQFNLDQLCIEMTDNNGTMHYDNTIDNDDEVITYKPWRVATGTLDQGTRSDYDINDPDNKDDRYADFLTTEISTARMTTDHDKVIRISYKDTGETVFQIPVNKWIAQLRSKKYQDMDEQEYLDREHNFELMVFLQDDGRGGWIATSIVINGFHIIDNGDTEL